MQPNILVLPVDAVNNGTLTDRSYRRFEEFKDRSVYVGPNHSYISPDTLSIYRTDPKPTASSRGVSKCAVKLSEVVSVPSPDGITNVESTLIGHVSFNLPIGMTPADLLEFRQRIIAVLDHDLMDSLMLSNEI